MQDGGRIDVYKQYTVRRIPAASFSSVNIGVIQALDRGQWITQLTPIESPRAIWVRRSRRWVERKLVPNEIGETVALQEQLPAPHGDHRADRAGGVGERWEQRHPRGAFECVQDRIRAREI